MIIAATIFKTIMSFIFDTRLGKGIAAGVLAVALFGGWLIRHDIKVENKVVAEINEKGKGLANEAEKARKGVVLDGAFARLRKSDCIGC